MNKKDTVVFDLDGTLLDTLEDLKNSVNYAMTQCGYPEHTLDEVRRYVGNGILLLMQRAIPGGKDDPNFDKAFTLFKEHMESTVTIQQSLMLALWSCFTL